jgi:hypothetical protein
VEYAVLGHPNQVNVADLNGDGAPDLAVLSDAFESVTILLGDGKGRFQNFDDRRRLEWDG